MRILITGATGFVGRYLTKALSSKHEIIVLTRSADRARKVLGEHTFLEWNETIEVPALDTVAPIDVVINLAGENVASKRWSSHRKDQIYSSRVMYTEKLFKALITHSIRPKLFIGASAIGFYGDRQDESLDENSKAGEGFLSKVVVDWEKQLLKNSKYVDRLAILRIGMVLGKGGGAISKMLPAFKLGVGAKLGNGKQYMSWIHINDLVKMFETIIYDDATSGVFNATTEFSVTNAEFTKTLSHLLQRPTLFSAPSFMLKMTLGEMSSMLLSGQRVMPTRFKALRFHFQYPTLQMALKEVVSISRKA